MGLGVCRRINAMIIGPVENCPAAALAVRPRRYPPGLLISSARCRIAAIVTAASASPMAFSASSQALGLIPSALRTVPAVATKSCQLEMP